MFQYTELVPDWKQDLDLIERMSFQTFSVTKNNPVIQQFGKIDLTTERNAEQTFEEVQRRHAFLHNHPVFSQIPIKKRDRLVAEACNLSECTVIAARLALSRYVKFRTRLEKRIVTKYDKIKENNFNLLNSELEHLLKTELYTILNREDVFNVLGGIMNHSRFSIKRIYERSNHYSSFKGKPGPKIKKTRSKENTFQLVQMMHFYLLQDPILQKESSTRNEIISKRTKLNICTIKSASTGSHTYKRFKDKVNPEILANFSFGSNQVKPLWKQADLEVLVENAMISCGLYTPYWILNSNNGSLYFDQVLPLIKEKHYVDVFFFLTKQRQESLKQELMNNYINRRKRDIMFSQH